MNAMPCQQYTSFSKTLSLEPVHPIHDTKVQQSPWCWDSFPKPLYTDGFRSCIPLIAITFLLTCMTLTAESFTWTGVRIGMTILGPPPF